MSSALKVISSKVITAILISFAISFTQDYERDTLAIRAILDSNEFYSVSAKAVILESADRVTKVKMATSFMGDPGTIPEPMSKLPSEIGELSELVDLELNLYSYDSVIMPPEFGNLVKLEKFRNDRGGPFKTIADEFWKLRNLKQLYLSAKIDTVSSEIKNLTNLTILSLRKSGIKKVPAEIGLLTNLNELRLEFNELSTVPKEIGNLTKLESLYLYSNHIETLPKEIENLTNLESFIIHTNRIEKIAFNIGNLINLRHIEFSSNKIDSISPEIGKLTKLSQLLLANNQLTSIPKEIGNLADSLRHLYLCDNRLTELPAEIGNCKNLESIRIYNNRLKSIPGTLENLTKIKHLRLESNRLTSLPDELFRLPALNRLDAQRNNLQSLSSAIGQAFRLERLDLSNNKLESIPKEIGDLNYMRWLTLDHNNLRTLPVEIAKLPHQSFLTTDFSHNKLDSNNLDDAVKLWLDRWDSDWRETQDTTTHITIKKAVSDRNLSLNYIQTSIQFHLAGPGITKLRIYNVKGTLLATVINSHKQPGSYSIKWNSNNLGSGIYLLKLTSGNNSVVRRIVVAN